MRYDFEWDSAKAKTNIRKHRVSFERAATVFLDPHAISIYDNEHSEKEDRWITMGRDNNETLLVVSHTFRKIDETSYTVRIISGRKATKREAKQYEG